jgi:predicted DCC family thiol-disulfide oxidoreductase YuxK
MTEKYMKPAHTIEMFYDGDCPFCMRETRMLSRMDRHDRIRFTNIAAPDFSPVSIGKTQDELIAEMHGRMADGSWVTGVEVFRQLYSAVGLGPVVWLTRLPIIKQVLNAGYYVFAKNRLRLTGRCSYECAIEAAKVTN